HIQWENQECRLCKKTVNSSGKFQHGTFEQATLRGPIKQRYFLSGRFISEDCESPGTCTVPGLLNIS
ncbi:MAG TPA: hypothetical protein H9782_02315, partial [Candidatus Bariatricus faecipullorum]|nr:hypothetical protein [Candidatus Bariatricus faecipullorum]